MRVLIADDERSAARALAVSLSSADDIAYVGTADCLQSAMDLTGVLAPDVVVVMLRLDDGNGITATAELKRRYPNLRVIVLTDVFDTEIIPRAAAARASALLPEDGELSEMLEMIRDDESDEFYVNPRVHSPLGIFASRKGASLARARRASELRSRAARW